MSTSTQALEFLHEGKIAEGEEVATDTQDAIYFPVCQRDPNDIRTILRLAIAAILFATLSLALAALLTYKLTRSPSLIVVERTQTAIAWWAMISATPSLGLCKCLRTGLATVTRNTWSPGGPKASFR